MAAFVRLRPLGPGVIEMPAWRDKRTDLADPQPLSNKELSE